MLLLVSIEFSKASSCKNQVLLGMQLFLSDATQ